MPFRFSVYLDLIRTGAALLVFLSHAAYPRFPGGAPWVPAHLSHEAVVVFFVLSGYVIAYVAHERERTLRDYLISRAARIYPVVLASLALTWAIDMWRIGIGAPDSVPAYQLASPWKYLPLFLTFTNDIWFLNEDAFSNVPYWSLCYEVWYYIAFAAAFFLSGWLRYVAVGVVLAIMGPRLWLLFPLWLAGVAVYWLQRRAIPGCGASRVLFAGSLALLLTILASGIDLRLDQAVNGLTGGWVGTHLRYSKWFAGDWLVALLIAANIHAARNAQIGFGVLAGAIGYFAGFSFSLYLLHFPLLQFFAQFSLPPLILLAAVLLSVWAVGLVVEQQKNRVRTMLRRLFSSPCVTNPAS